MHKPLSGLKVLDFTRLYAGPFATMLLGDLGADVVKIEMPGGDPVREAGPPFHHGHCMSFLAVNRNKRSVVLDMKSKEGQEIAYEMALKADVIVENFRPGVMERLGLSYDKLKEVNPGLVWASISGMGADGPDADLGNFDLTIQAMGGFMSITGERGGNPIKLGTSVFDLVCGQYAMGAITSALFDRSRTGKGQRVETSLFESQLSFLVDAAEEYLVLGKIREKWGSEHFALAPYKAFKTADGWVVIGAGNQNLFEAFLKAINRMDMLQDERFAKNSARVQNRAALHEQLDAEVLKYNTDDIVALLRTAKVPSAPVNNMEQVFNHPQTLHRKMVQTVTHPEYGDIRVVGSAVKYSSADVTDGWTAPPLLGEHTEEVISDWLGATKAAE